MRSKKIRSLECSKSLWLKSFMLVILFWNTSCKQEIASNEACRSFVGLENLENIRCGVLVVPKDHDASNETKTLQISYAVVPAKHPNLKNAPMIFLSGGPGNATLTTAQMTNWLGSELREDRDIILFDQRGIGLSSPLPNMLTELYDIMGANVEIDEEEAMIGSLFESYASNAQIEDISLENYNTIQSAQDVGMLMQHLGYESYNLYGVSYGARLARVVQEMYPDYLNSVILNSPAPIEGDFLLDRLQSYSLALNRVFDYCKSDLDCKVNYPNLKESYFEMVNKLEEEPVRIEIDGKSFYINPQDGVYFVRRALYSTNSRSLVPSLIKELKDGGGPIIRGLVENEFWASYNFAMWLAVERFEMYSPDNTKTVVEEVYASLPLLPVKLGHFTTIYSKLALLHNGTISPDDKKLSKSLVPTLIMVNQFDPVTPPENGHILMEMLSKGKLLILDEGGHAGGNRDCRNKVMADFMDAPNAELDVSCLRLYASLGD